MRWWRSRAARNSPRRRPSSAEARALQVARASAELGRRRGELRAARERHQRIEAALAEASAADAFLADHPLTAAQLTAIREASDELRIVEARLGDAAPTVRITAERSFDLLLDGEPITVTSGGYVERQVPDQLVISLPGSLAVQLRAGASLADRQADRDHARRVLDRACATAGVRDRAAAEDARRATAGIRSDQLALAAEVARLRDIATEAATAASHDRDELASTRDRLDAARAAVPDAALRDVMARAAAELEQADEG